MRFSLLPKADIFYQLLEELSCRAQESVKVFQKLLLSWNPTHPAIYELRDLEHFCDKVVHEIMVALNKTFITPIDREDIHHLAKTIDDVVDTIHALNERMLLFQVQSVTEELKEMASVLEKSLEIVTLLISKIKDLKNANELFDLCVQIHTLENQGDRLFERALRQLFLNPTDPIEVIKWKEIYDFLEKAIDISEDIADIVWGIVVKYG